METIFAIQLIVFMAVFLFVFALLKIAGKKKTITLSAAETSAAVRLGGFRYIIPENGILGTAGATLVNNLFPNFRKQLRRKLTVAGINDLLSDESIIGAQLLCGGLGAALATCFVLLFTIDLRFAFLAAVFCGSMGIIYPSLWLKRKAQARQEQIAKDLPFAIDLLTVAVQAGQDFGAAVRLLLDEGIENPLIDEFRQVMEDIQLGKTRVQSLQDMSQRIDLDEFRNLVAVVSQSVEMGAGLGEVFQLQATEMRRRRFHAAERKAARAPSLMIIPTALFILPATFIVILVPVILKLLMTVKGMQ